MNMMYNVEHSMAAANGHLGSRAFFSGHPVFRREDYAQAVGRTSDDQVVSAMLTQHLRSGNIRRIARSVFAAVPPHGKGLTWPVDHYLAASRLRPDAVLAYHSALEIHGCAYTDAPNAQAISESDPTVFKTAEFSCRFLRQPAGFDFRRDVMIVDRAGLDVRVTTLERTIVDAFDRIDLVGGSEELLNSLALVPRVKLSELLRPAKAMQNAGARGALGWWLERERSRLGISSPTLAALRALKPRHPQYVLGAKKGDAKFVSDWNILVPRAVTTDRFEGA